MRKIAFAGMLVVFAARGLAAETPATSDPMAGWSPPKITKEKEDRKEIGALFKAMDQAGQKGDIDAAAELIDFPVLMVTDDAKGQASADQWDREKWIEVMKPFYKPMPGMKVTHKPTTFLMTDSLATVNDDATITMGQKKLSTRSSMLLVRKDGTWRVKSMVEGGWGGMMESGAAAPAQATPDARQQATPDAKQ